MPGIRTMQTTPVRQGVTVNSSLNAVVNAEGAQTVALFVTSTTSLAGVWEGTFEDIERIVNGAAVGESGADWFDLASLQTNDSGVTAKLPLATITVADDDVLYAHSGGARYVRFRRTAGSGTCDLGVSDVSIKELADAAGSLTQSVNAYGPLRYKEVTCTLDTSQYASGDVLFDSQIVTACVRANDSMGWLVYAGVLDEDDQTAFDLDLVILKANVSLGSENSAVSITDANAREIVGTVSLLQTTTPSVDLINNKRIAVSPNHKDMPMPVIPVSGSDDIYIAGILRSGTPTFSASGIRLLLGFKDA